MTTPPAADDLPPDSRETGLPLLRTWPAVYLTVTAIFALWVTLLRLLTEAFS